MFDWLKRMFSTEDEDNTTVKAKRTGWEEDDEGMAWTYRNYLGDPSAWAYKINSTTYTWFAASRSGTVHTLAAAKLKAEEALRG